jgi:hypothetical protein
VAGHVAGWVQVRRHGEGMEGGEGRGRQREVLQMYWRADCTGARVVMVWPGPAAFVAQVALPTPDEVRLLQAPLIDAYEAGQDKGCELEAKFKGTLKRPSRSSCE